MKTENQNSELEVVPSFISMHADAIKRGGIVVITGGRRCGKSMVERILKAQLVNKPMGESPMRLDPAAEPSAGLKAHAPVSEQTDGLGSPPSCKATS